MGYKEEIFSRVELTGFTTKSQIQDWLSGKGTPRAKNRSSYSNFASQLAEPFGLREEIEKEKDYDKLKNLKSQAQQMELSDPKTVKLAEDKLKEIGGELAELTEQRREKRLEEERVEREIIKAQKKLLRKEDRISLSTESQLIKLQSELDEIGELGVDTSIQQGLINERILEIEEEKESRKIREKERREEKNRMIEEGKRPEF